MLFIKVKKTCFLCFYFHFFMFLCAFFNVVFLLLKQKTYKITNMMHFSWAKTPFPGQSDY